MVRAILSAGLSAALLFPAPARAQPVEPQPTLAELEAALLAHHSRIVTLACGMAKGCYKPPKAIKVRNYDCQATGADPRGQPIIYCRVTYVHKGGTMATVKSPNECVPLRAPRAEVGVDATQRAWQVAMVDHKGKCPGARE